MIIDTINNWRSPVRRITAKAELYLGSAFAEEYTANDALKSFSVERVGEEGKFFGFGICQKLSLKLIDKDRAKAITPDHSFKVYVSGGEFITPFPAFKVAQARRDENTNELSITAYDALYGAASLTVADLVAAKSGSFSSYTIREFAEACAALLNCSGLVIQGVADVSCFNTYYGSGANFEGTESIRSALDAIAEVTQTIYYINYNNKLCFKRLDKSGAPALTITKEDYIKLESSDSRRLSQLVHVTELGDNVSSTLDLSGSTQYIRDNPFWELREDVGTLLNKALAAIGGLTINQFTCEWRGNLSLEIGDKIGLVTKDNKVTSSFILDDIITYSGALSASTKWRYSEAESETAANPSTLGDALNKTFARVDKVNQEITLQVKRINDTDGRINEVQGELATYRQTATEALLEFQTTIEKDGVTKVDTGTGFRFDATGLNISKTDSEMSTTITEDGMEITRGGEVVLTADNQGVKAEDLHATTYLIIGNNSRLEDYGARTGCFWLLD